VRVGHQDNEFEGWWWCTGPDGRAGWMPAEILERRGETAEATEDYSANELSVRMGQRVAVVRALHGWVRVRNETGEEGWIPLACIDFESTGRVTSGWRRPPRDG
jgi:hypothetical protein